ncbi:MULTISPECIES: hypothetical protein [Streptomyces]|uniref:hypothetical protein n=1 Tax=Streptomyces TaxID=1883 RepID=UPI0004BFCD6E|nr:MULTISPECIES: hypothetical protein [Streptomyces]WSQ21795.1 hypothetical protein OG237_32370 [Streptomyces zaomyceticus]
MTTTDDIARAHGHTGPTNCQDCGTTENVHFGSYWNPETKEAGNFLQCCACGIKAGDHLIDHADCGAAITQYVLNRHTDSYSERAYARVHAAAVESYGRGNHDAHHLELDGQAAHEHALSAVLDSVGRSYAAAAIDKVADFLVDKVDEETYLALGQLASSLDLYVVEDLNGANGA